MDIKQPCTLVNDFVLPCSRGRTLVMTVSDELFHCATLRTAHTNKVKLSFCVQVCILSSQQSFTIVLTQGFEHKN